MEKIFSHVKVDYDELEFDKFIEFFKDKKRVEEILNGARNTKLGKSKKKKESTR